MSPLRAGARAMLPYLVGVAPLGAAIGATVAEQGIDPLAGWSTSWVIFSGTPQMLTVELLAQGAAPAVIVVTVLAVNLRLTVYSAALVGGWRGAPLWFRVVASYLITDPVYVVAVRHGESAPTPSSVRHHYLGAAGTLWVGWLVACGAGLGLGGALTELVPPSLFLELILIGMLVPLARRGSTRAAAVAAGAFALPCVQLLAGLGPVAAGAAGAAVAWWHTGERRGTRVRDMGGVAR